MRFNYSADKFNKYHAKKCEYKGMTFDSKRELSRYYTLELMQQAGQIKNLERQVKYVLAPAKFKDMKKRKGLIMRECTYIADFTYEDAEGRFVVEDAKGMRTDAYQIKKKWLYDKYGLIISEV